MSDARNVTIINSWRVCREYVRNADIIRIVNEEGDSYEALGMGPRPREIQIPFRPLVVAAKYNIVDTKIEAVVEHIRSNGRRADVILISMSITSHYATSAIQNDRRGRVTVFC